MIENKNTILITGASGLIGRALLTDLIARNSYEIRAHIRSSTEARTRIGNTVNLTRVCMEEGDFTRAGDSVFGQLTKGCDVVVHAAGLVHRPDAAWEEYEVVNVRATQNLAEAAAANGAKTFIFISSSAVYGPGPFDRVSESGPLNAKTPYAVSKLTSERWLQNFKGISRIVILRPSLVFGEGDRGNLLSMIREIKNNRFKLIGDGSTGKSIIYSHDLAHAIALCLKSLSGGVHVLNVANPEPVSIKCLADEIVGCLGSGVKITSVPPSLARLGLKAAELLMPGKLPTVEQLEKLTTTTTCSVTKLTESTGFQPRHSLGSALAAEIAWAQASKLI